jgi:hypothetical protein
VWPTVEHYFQAGKFVNDSDKERIRTYVGSLKDLPKFANKTMIKNEGKSDHKDWRLPTNIWNTSIFFKNTSFSDFDSYRFFSIFKQTGKLTRKKTPNFLQIVRMESIIDLLKQCRMVCYINLHKIIILEMLYYRQAMH